MDLFNTWGRICYLSCFNASSHFSEDNSIESKEEISNSKTIYFDILIIFGYTKHMSFMCFIMYVMHYFSI